MTTADDDYAAAKRHLDENHRDSPVPSCPWCEGRIDFLRTDNFLLRQAIGRHRERIMSLGKNTDRKGNEVWGSEWDRELWAALYEAFGPVGPDLGYASVAFQITSDLPSADAERLAARVHTVLRDLLPDLMVRRLDRLPSVEIISDEVWA